jgi:hypothetical protein
MSQGRCPPPLPNGLRSLPVARCTADNVSFQLCDVETGATITLEGSRQPPELAAAAAAAAAATPGCCSINMGKERQLCSTGSANQGWQQR